MMHEPNKAFQITGGINYVLGVYVQGVYVRGEGVCVLGGICPVVKCPVVKCPGGGICPGVSV